MWRSVSKVLILAALAAWSAANAAQSDYPSRPVKMVVAGHDAFSARHDRAVPTRHVVRFEGDVAVERATKRREGRIQKNDTPEIGSVNLQEARPLQALRPGEAMRNACRGAHRR